VVFVLLGLRPKPSRLAERRKINGYKYTAILQIKHKEKS